MTGKCQWQKVFLVNVDKDSARDTGIFLGDFAEAVAWRCSVKKMFLKISQNSQENTCAKASF